MTVRYWASVRAAAGRPEETVEASTLAGAIAAIRERRPDDDRFDALLGICSMIVDGAPVGRRDATTVELTDGAVVELLPPFAGG